MIVPELPEVIRGLKERMRRFVEQEVYPLEVVIAERGAIDAGEVEELRRTARLGDAEHAGRPRRTRPGLFKRGAAAYLGW